MNNLPIATYIVIILLIVTGCAPSPATQLDHLNGYWEIASIENQYGSSKEYSISQNIDFFEVTPEGKGIRKKVQPDIQGNFTASNSSQNIDVVLQEKAVFLKYSTALDTWQEEIISLSQDELILKNSEGYTYTYRRYKALTTNN